MADAVTAAVPATETGDGAGTRDRAVFRRLPALADLVATVALVDRLPVAVDAPREGFWVARDDRVTSWWPGDDPRSLELTLGVARRRGGPVVLGGGDGDPHVAAAAIAARELGLDVEAVVFPQHPDRATVWVRDILESTAGLTLHRVPHPWLVPVTQAVRMRDLAPRRPTLVPVGGATAPGVMGFVSAALEITEALDGAGAPRPATIVAPLAAGTAVVGLALGLQLAGWRDTTVTAVVTGDPLAGTRPAVWALAARAAALIAAADGGVHPVRITFDRRWVGAGYGHPTAEVQRLARRADRLDLTVEPTRTAKAFAAAWSLREEGTDVVYLHTWTPGGRRD